jgi:hypothetical protein
VVGRRPHRGLRHGAAAPHPPGAADLLHPAAKRTARLATWLAACAIGADLVENALLLAALRVDAGSGWLDWLLRAAAATAVVKFAAILVAGAVSLVTVPVVLGRLRNHRQGLLDARPQVETRQPPPISVTGDDETPGDAGEAAAPAHAAVTSAPASASASAPASTSTPTSGSLRWRNAYEVPDVDVSGAKPVVGFCVSGGGIRSASVALGALQVLRPQLLAARYLVSVSGGGYTAGALRLALQPLPAAEASPKWWRAGDTTPRGSTAAEPATVFAAGSVEEDHLRRHSSYLADGAGQWLGALAVVLRGLLASLTLVALTGRRGRPAGRAALLRRPARRPLRPPAAWLTDGPARDLGAPDFPTPTPGVATALALLGGAAAFAYVVALQGFVRAGHRSVRPLEAARALTGLTVLVAAAGVAIPAIVWGSAALTWVFDRPAPVAFGGAAGTVVLTYVATLVGVLWRHRKPIGKRVSGLLRRDKGEPQQRFATSMLQRAGRPARACRTRRRLPAAVRLGRGHRRPWGIGPIAGVLLALVLAAALLDQTWLGLHPSTAGVWRRLSPYARCGARTAGRRRPVRLRPRAHRPCRRTPGARRVTSSPRWCSPRRPT